jgi:hypothetical protein
MDKTIAKRVGTAGLVVLGVALLFGKAEAKSKSNPVVEANIPYAFHLANRTLPAGNYKFELATGTPTPSDRISVLIVRNREGRIYQAIAVSVQARAGLPDESRVVFDSGEEHTLVSLWKDGDRFDLQRTIAASADDADDWTSGVSVVTVSARLSER